MAARKKAAKPKPEEVEEEVELDEVEEADDEDEEEAEEPAEEIWGVQDLCKHVKAKTGKDYKPREMRNLLRKMARDGRIDREIIPGNKARYSWDGPNDPEVKAVVKAVKGGEIEQAKKEALDKLKADKAKKDAAKKKAATKSTKGKKSKPAPEPDEDEDEDEDDDDE